MYKKLLIVFILMILLSNITACSEEPNSFDPDGNNILIKNDIYDQEINLYKRPYVDAKEQYAYLPEWSQVINNTFGLNIKVNILPAKTDIKEYFAKTTNGLYLMHLSNASFIGLYDLMKSDSIIPVTDFVEDNENMKQFDHEFINSIKDSNGDLWFFPAGKPRFNNFRVRGYIKEWLEKNEYKVPENIYDFQNLMHTLTYEDPDSNSIDDTYGLRANTRLTHDFKDILNAFSVYSDYFFVEYNPRTQTVEDGILSDSALDALYYIRNLYESKYVYSEELSKSNSFLLEHKIGSFIEYFRYTDQTQKLIFADYPLVADSNENLIAHDKIFYAYAMLKGTSNPEKVFDTFVDTFYGSLEGNMMLKYGIPNSMFRIVDKDNVVHWDKKNSYGERIYDRLSMLSTLPKFENIKEHYNEVRTPVKNEMELKTDKYLENVQGAFYSMPFNYLLIRRDLNSQLGQIDNYNKYFELINSGISNEGMPIDDLVEEYRTNMKKLSIQQIIDNANMKIGQRSVYRY